MCNGVEIFPRGGYEIVRYFIAQEFGALTRHPITTVALGLTSLTTSPTRETLLTL